VILTRSVEDKNVAKTKRRLRLLLSVMKLGGYIMMLVVSLALLILLAWMGIYFINQTGNLRRGVLLLVFAAGFILAEGLLLNYASLRAKVSAQQPTHSAVPSAASNNKCPSKDQSFFGMSVAEQSTALLGEKIESRPVDQ
jgi:hypothetical protein